MDTACTCTARVELTTYVQRSFCFAACFRLQGEGRECSSIGSPADCQSKTQALCAYKLVHCSQVQVQESQYHCCVLHRLHLYLLGTLDSTCSHSRCYRFKVQTQSMCE
eukprot:4034114-Amphidinium_carterae.1